jgi:AraC family transcriptional activator FtrA
VPSVPGQVAAKPTIVVFVPSLHRVVALALPSVILLDLAAPTHLFGHCGGDRYRFKVAGLRAGRVASSTGIEISVRHGLGALEDADTIVIPGTDDVAATAGFRRAADAVARAHRRGTRVMSVCTGAFLLAEAGLLDGRRATTHWDSASALSQRFPAVEVDPDVLYVDDGSVLTSAGVAAGLDLCLHVVRKDHGAAAAAELARRAVVAPHREGGQAQFIPPVGNRAAETMMAHSSTAPARSWALAHLDQPLPAAILAQRAAMSPRTFARRFRAETGTTPAQWVLEQRLRAAQTMLETTSHPVEQIAQRSGFSNAAALRAHFARRLATTPTAYRRNFASPAASRSTAHRSSCAPLELTQR